jgi:hypothetical protein
MRKSIILKGVLTDELLVDLYLVCQSIQQGSFREVSGYQFVDKDVGAFLVVSEEASDFP